MPVGFENSALKMSFSLSSLEPGGGQGSPQMVRLQAERPYNSLTKKSRTAEQEMWRRSWSTQEKKDEFWAALQPNYNYLMDNNLIESCKEASGEFPRDKEVFTPLLNWSFKDFAAQFSELCSWLNSIREAVYGKISEENIINRNLRLEHVEAMHQKVYRRKLFTEQAERLLAEHSDLQDEVTWRLRYLNSKWDMLEQSISPSKKDTNQESLSTDVEHEAHCLKEWIHEMEGRLKPLNMQVANDWSIQELVEKMTEYEVLHQDIKAHGKVVAAVLRRAELAKATASARLAKRLERRWHLLFLRALEWQFHVEHLLKRRSRPSALRASSDSDEEPVTKQRRLSAGEGDASDQLTDDGSYFEDDIKNFCVMDGNKTQATSTPNEVPVQERSTSECCVGSDNSGSVNERHVVQKRECNKIMSLKGDSSVINDHNNVQTSGTWEEKQTGTQNCQHTRPQKILGNCATFSFKHQDTDSEQDSTQQKAVEESSEEEWTYTASSVQNVDEHAERMRVATNTGVQRRSNVAVKLNFEGNVDSSRSKSGGKRSAKSSTSEKEIEKIQSVEHLKVTVTTKCSSSKESIQRLVSQAELLVREENSTLALPLGAASASSQAKQARIRKWLRMHKLAADNKGQLPDSCDASGEYTTGDSDEDCTLQSPEEYNECVLMNKHLEALLTGSPSMGSDEASLYTDVTPVGKKQKCTSPSCQEDGSKVTLRGKQRSQRERPWSVSGVPQLSPTHSQRGSKLLTHLSTSESALHQMFQSTSPPVKDMSSPVLNTNVSSSTIDETTIAANEGQSCPAGSLRRRKRLRKRSLLLTAGRKSESGSDGVTPAQSGSSDTQQVSSSSMTHRSSLESNAKVCCPALRTSSPAVPCTLVKSQSFSGTCSSRASEQCIPTDSAQPHHRNSRSCESSGTETEEEQLGPVPNTPMFRLGPEQGSVTVKPSLLPLRSATGDSDVDRSSAAPGTEEQLSSFSEQAWDNYQEKYMSEPYSEEIADSDTARRLLDFGDDYYKYLGSTSDCASSLDTYQKVPSRRRKINLGADNPVLDSDSDLEDIHHLIHQSHSQLVFTKQVLSKQNTKVSTERRASDYAEIVATCRENKRCLSVILENVKGEILSEKDCKEITGLLEKWSSLEAHAEELQSTAGLQQELSSLRKDLLDMSPRISSLVNNISDRSDLECRIQLAKEEMTRLTEYKKHLLHLNVAVHQLATDPHLTDIVTVPSPLQLKDTIADLYRIWNSAFESVSMQMSRLERAVDTWRVFDTQFTSLQSTLQDDHNTLTLLRSELDGGTQAIATVANSVRDVARVLTETSLVRHKIDSSSCQKNSADAVTVPEGSLSDSGISDSGSEQELSERARRLAVLRRLARHLRAELLPTGNALAEIEQHIELLDGELRQLQGVCHQLVMRTSDGGSSVPYEVSGTPEPTCPASDTVEPSLKRNLEDSDEQPRKKGRRPWLWRVARTALPFQIAIVAVLCLACFLEPHCCDGINNLNLSLTPQLRYVRGPPPV